MTDLYQEWTCFGHFINDLFVEHQETKTQVRSSYVLEGENKKHLSRKSYGGSALGLAHCWVGKPLSYVG